MNTQSATLTSSTPGVYCQMSRMHPNRSISLYCFDRQVHTVGGIGFNHVNPIAFRASTGTTSNQLTYNIPFTRTVVPTKHHCQHLTRGFCTYHIRNNGPHRAQDTVSH